MDRILAFISCAEPQQLQAMWTELFLDESVALAVASAEKEVVVQFLKKADGLHPTWTPTKCAVRIEHLTETTMAAESSFEYSAAYIYSLALLCEVDPIKVKLSDKQVEVAFKLAKYWKSLGKRAAAAGGPGGAGSGGGGAPGASAGHEAQATGPEEEQGDKGEGEPAPMEWEDQLEPLEDDLDQVLQRFQQGLLNLDARSIMESLPLWVGVKQKTE